MYKFRGMLIEKKLTFPRVAKQGGWASRWNGRQAKHETEWVWNSCQKKASHTSCSFILLRDCLNPTPFRPLCCGVLQCWKWSACRVRWSSCRNSWQASRCYKTLSQPVNISLKCLTTSLCLLYCSHCILVLHINFSEFVSELRNDLTSKRNELQKCVNDLKEKNQRDARMSKWKET